MDKRKNRLTVRDIALFGVLGALTFAMKFAMAWLPNIEPVSLMILVMAACLGWKALYPVYLYVALEILVYGIGQWNLCYLYVWAILAVAAILLRKTESPLLWALLSAVFGLAFGALCGIADIFIGGRYIPGYWVRESIDSPTVFLDDQGNEIQLTRGKTFIAHFPPEALLAYGN